MKRVQLNSTIENHARRALGADVDLNSIVIFEASALNTQPLRKRHPLYFGARVDRSMLYEMAASLASESVPVHVEHVRGEGLPFGRVFHGEVLENGAESELRTLFFVDASETEAIAKIENGTVDQVSVSILPKKVLNSKSGFDYLGPEATFEHIMTGTDPEGNTLNEDGVYARLVNLDAFFEMSLVGQGAARNARIVRREESHFGPSFQKLAASGVDPNALVLVATSETQKMDLTALIADLTDRKVELQNKTTEIAGLNTQVATLSTEKAALEARLAELADVPAALEAKDAEIATLSTDKTAVETNLSAAVEALKDVAKKVLVASGNLEPTIPDSVEDLAALIASTETGLAAVLVAGGKAAPTDAPAAKAPAVDFTAFSTRR